MSVEISSLGVMNMRSGISQWKQWMIWQSAAKNENGADLR